MKVYFYFLRSYPNLAVVLTLKTLDGKTVANVPKLLFAIDATERERHIEKVEACVGGR